MTDRPDETSVTDADAHATRTTGVYDLPRMPPRVEPTAEPSASTRRSHWRWVLRNWWVVLLTMALGALLGVVTAWGAPTIYRSEAVVTAATTNIPSGDFGPLAEAAFATDTVLQPVIDELGLQTTPRELLATDQLSAESVGGTVALRITARARDPQLASDLATTAASSFATAAQDREMGTFAVFGPEGNPGVSEPSPITPSAVFGLLAGGLLAFTGLLIVSLGREPVSTEDEIALELDADDIFVARVSKPFVERLLPGEPRWKIDPNGLVAAVWRVAAAARTVDGGALLAGVTVESVAGQEPKLLAMLKALEAGAPDEVGGRAAFVAASLGSHALPDALATAPAIVALVNYGAERRLLRRMAEEIRMAPGEKKRIAVLVR